MEVTLLSDRGASKDQLGAEHGVEHDLTVLLDDLGVDLLFLAAVVGFSPAVVEGCADCHAADCLLGGLLLVGLLVRLD